MSKSSQNIIRTIRNDTDQIESIIEYLDANDANDADDPIKSTKNGKRRGKRFPYRHKGFFVHLQQPGEAAPKRYLVEPRNLGDEGIAFLHGGFVHVGSGCNVRLISLHGSYDEVEGQVVRCRYIEGKIHEVAVQFFSPIETARYCVGATRKSVLFADDDPSMLRIAKAFLGKLNVHLDLAEDGNQAIEKATANAYDLILMDVEMPNMDGLAATRELRKRGYSGQITAVTDRTQPSDKQVCLDAGCNDCIIKPLTQDSLAQALNAVNQELFFSTLPKDPVMVELVNAFVADLPAMIRAIEEALAQDDWAKLESHTRALKSAGTSYGFRILTDIAAEVESALIAKSPVERVRNQVYDLIKLCLQVRSSARPPGLTEDAQSRPDANAKSDTAP